VLKEPLGGAHRDHAEAAASLERFLTDSLRELKRYKTDTILRKRYERVRHQASFFTSASERAKARVKPSQPRAARTRRTVAAAVPVETSVEA
jgi:hypothetical protein